MERTLSIIKPDAVERNLIGNIVKRFEDAGIRIVAMKTLKLSKAQAEAFYAVHKERPFYGELTDYMSSGPCVPMILEGEGVILKNREIMGATDPKQAAAGTIRADLALDKEKNSVHGSDAPETAVQEIGFFFTPYELAG
ncbi:MAG: nucleoside-diphosphate kinase [Desulfatibacillum sp.]|nr:nucleoside-diphosphate kinase [Desulfatibacillum sp.]